MTKQANSQIQKQPKELTEQELQAKIALTGNLADLTPEQQMSYYVRYCAHLGLDPITRPFDLLTTFDESGTPKTVLYANASCSAQLADRREISYSKPEKEYDHALNVLIIRVEAFIKLRDGQFRGCWRSGVAHIENLKGKRLENAIKKAETQAHRRATLALCGVAMPDESEIEDIPNAQIRAAIEMPTAEEVFDSPRQSLNTPLPAAWTDDSVARQLADQKIANKINAELKTISKEIASAEEAAQDVRDLAEELAKSDPVPLPVTLTPAQQKVSDAVGAAWREHGKDKNTVLHLVGQFLGRPVRASKELSNEEAEKVFAYLQTIGSQWSDEAKTEPMKYGQRNPRYDAKVAIELDEIIKKLTILKISSPLLSQMIQNVVTGVSGRQITNRYEMTNDEALAVIDYLRDQLGQKECERAIGADQA